MPCGTIAGAETRGNANEAAGRIPAHGRRRFAQPWDSFDLVQQVLERDVAADLTGNKPDTV